MCIHVVFHEFFGVLQVVLLQPLTSKTPYFTMFNKPAGGYKRSYVLYHLNVFRTNVVLQVVQSNFI